MNSKIKRCRDCSKDITNSWKHNCNGSTVIEFRNSISWLSGLGWLVLIIVVGLVACRVL